MSHLGKIRKYSSKSFRKKFPKLPTNRPPQSQSTTKSKSIIFTRFALPLFIIPLSLLVILFLILHLQMNAFSSCPYPQDDAVISNIEFASARRKPQQRQQSHDHDNNDDNDDDASTVPYNPEEEHDNNNNSNNNNNNDNLLKYDNNDDTCRYRRVARKRKAVVVNNNNNNNTTPATASAKKKKHKKKPVPPSPHVALLIPPPRQASAYHGSLGAVIDGVMLHFDDDLFVFLQHLQAAIDDGTTFTIKAYSKQYDLPRTTTGRLSRTLRHGGNYFDADLGKQWQVIVQAFREWQSREEQGGQDDHETRDSGGDSLDEDKNNNNNNNESESDNDENGNNDDEKDYCFLDNTPTTATSALDKYIWRQFDGDCFAFLQHLCQAMNNDDDDESSSSFSVADYCRQYGLPVQRSTLHRVAAMVRGDGRDPCLGKVWWTRWQQFQLQQQQVQQQQQQVVAAQFSESGQSRQARAARRAAARNEEDVEEQEQGEIIPPPPRMDNNTGLNDDNANPTKEAPSAGALVTPPFVTQQADNLSQRRHQNMEPSQLYPPLLEDEQELPIQQRLPNATPIFMYNDDGIDQDDVGLLVSWKVAVGMGILAFFAFWGPVALLLTLHHRWIISSSSPPPPPSPGFCWD